MRLRPDGNADIFMEEILGARDVTGDGVGNGCRPGGTVAPGNAARVRC